MTEVWKFPCPIADEFGVEMPIGAEVLTVQVQGRAPYIWALVDPDAQTVTRKFQFRGTGQPLEPFPIRQYIGTCQMSEGEIVFHLFEDMSL